MSRDQGSEPDPPQYGRLGLRPSGRPPPCGAAGPRRPGAVEPARAPEPWLGGFPALLRAAALMPASSRGRRFRNGEHVELPSRRGLESPVHAPTERDWGRRLLHSFRFDFAAPTLPRWVLVVLRGASLGSSRATAFQTFAGWLVLPGIHFCSYLELFFFFKRGEGGEGKKKTSFSLKK